MVVRTAQLADEGRLTDQQAALSKAFATAKARETVSWARELLGGGERAARPRGRAHRGLGDPVQQALGRIAKSEAVDDVRGGEAVERPQPHGHPPLGQILLVGRRHPQDASTARCDIR